jgi:hypothetical protein
MRCSHAKIRQNAEQAQMALDMGQKSMTYRARLEVMVEVYTECAGLAS